MFDKIITVSLNPSLDTTIWVNRFDLKEPVRSTREMVHPGGKAINVSRVLTALGVENHSIGAIGAENSKRLRDLLDLEKVSYDFFTIDGYIRENLSIVLPGGDMFKINRSGFHMSDAGLKKVKQQIKQNLSGCTNAVLLFAGSLPCNISVEQYKKLIHEFKSENVKICIDTDILTEDDLKKIKPFIIKPNLAELCHIAGAELKTMEEIHEYASHLAKYAEHVLVSLGARGLVYVNSQTSVHCIPPSIVVQSTVGAGDTTLAGFIAKMSTDASVLDCCKYATACGTASVLLEGTGVITKESADALFTKIDVSEI